MHSDFRMPGRSKLTGRKSTLTGLFLTSLTPCIEPSDDEIREALKVLGMQEGKCVCAYCGGPRSEWDHFRPIVQKRGPTGFITEIANLVPSCGKCNQSKGNKPWKTWITSAVRHAPGHRRVPGLARRIKRLEAYEKWRDPVQLDYIAQLGKTAWKKHLQYLQDVLDLLAKAEHHASRCREVIGKVAVKRRRRQPFS
jgi:hypothetical protein